MSVGPASLDFGSCKSSNCVATLQTAWAVSINRLCLPCAARRVVGLAAFHAKPFQLRFRLEQIYSWWHRLQEQGKLVILFRTEDGCEFVTDSDPGLREELVR